MSLFVLFQIDLLLHHIAQYLTIPSFFALHLTSTQIHALLTNPLIYRCIIENTLKSDANAPYFTNYSLPMEFLEDDHIPAFMRGPMCRVENAMKNHQSRFDFSWGDTPETYMSMIRRNEACVPDLRRYQGEDASMEVSQRTARFLLFIHEFQMLSDALNGMNGVQVWLYLNEVISTLWNPWLCEYLCEDLVGQPLQQVRHCSFILSDCPVVFPVVKHNDAPPPKKRSLIDKILGRSRPPKDTVEWNLRVENIRGFAFFLMQDVGFGRSAQRTRIYFFMNSHAAVISYQRGLSTVKLCDFCDDSAHGDIKRELELQANREIGAFWQLGSPLKLWDDDR